MVRKVKTEKIKGIGAGRRGYSQDIQVSTIPIIRSHQLRLSFAGRLKATSPILPGESALSVFVLIADVFRGTTMQLRKFTQKLSGGNMWKFELGWGNFDKDIEGYPLSEIIEYYYGSKYGYGELEIKIDKGISFNIPEDAEASDYYPRYLKYCPYIVFTNKSDQAQLPIVTATVTGFISKKAGGVT